LRDKRQFFRFARSLRAVETLLLDNSTFVGAMVVQTRRPNPARIDRPEAALYFQP
jgi:hypothetical protein